MIIATTLGTILTFSGAGFDATRVFDPAVAQVGDGYAMVYAGLPFGNSEQIGLATASTPLSWIKSSNSPVIGNTTAPSWASFRATPATLLYTGGQYQLWFNGDNTNLDTDPGRQQGFGYASSADGIHWNVNATPIRVVSNSRSGATVRSVAKLGGIYHAYFTYASGGTTYEATSSDGMNFSADIPVGVPAGYDLLATTTVTVAGQEQILSVWDSGGNEYYSLSSDGSNFTMADSIALPSNFGISNILVENGQLEMFGPAGAGNVNWPYGNTVIQYATATLNLDNIPEPATNMVFAVCLGGLAVLRMWRRDTTSSTRSAVPT